jgi:hypothetical protein
MFAQTDLRAADVRIRFQKMLAEREAEFFVFNAEFFLRENIDGILHRIRRDDQPVVGLRVRRIEIALQRNGNVEFLQRMLLAIAGDFQDADARFAVLMLDKFHVAFLF